MLFSSLTPNAEEILENAYEELRKLGFEVKTKAIYSKMEDITLADDEDQMVTLVVNGTKYEV